MSKEPQQDLGQEPRFQVFSILVFTTAVAVMVAMTYVQNTLVRGSVEIAVRTCANLGGLIAVPILLAFGFKDWLLRWRSKLPAWWNGLALSSVVLPSLVWVGRFFESTVSVNSPFADSRFHVDPLSLLATFLYSNLLALLLAIVFLKGKSRLLVASAVFLLWAGLQSGIYF